MTSLRPALHSVRRRQELAVDILGERDRTDLRALLDSDPIVNVLLAARMRGARTMAAAALGGRILGVRRGGRLVAGAFVGASVLPFGDGDGCWAALSSRLAGDARTATSIVGRAEVIASVWPPLTQPWGPPRAIRAVQPLLATRSLPQAAADLRVRAVRAQELERYLPAAIEMFSEELGIRPDAGDALASYRRRIGQLIAARRAFAIFADDGSVVFKADIGAVSDQACQLQGVWVRPDLRGRGLGTAAVAAVIARGLTFAPTVSLYVNDFNVAARRTYARLGMREVATLTTVLL